MTSYRGVCPHCGALAQLDDMGSWDTSDYVIRGVLCCMSCDGAIAFEAPNDGTSTLSRTWPSMMGAVTFDVNDVPEGIASDAQEAHRSLQASCPRASVVMARRALQRAAFDRGAPNKPLVAQIDWLHENDRISADIKDAAHAIRVVANSGAHPVEHLDEVDDEVAAEVLELLANVLAVTYQMPARSERLKARTTRAPGSA